MVLDKITETIAHFIGLFEISVEEVRIRESYRKFEPAASHEQDAPVIDPRSVSIRSPHEFDGFDPYIPYTPVAPTLDPAWTALDLIDRRFDIEVSPHHGWHQFASHRLPVQDQISSGGAVRLPTLDPPGSVAVIVEQRAVMSDDDTISYGGHGLTPHALFDPVAALEALAAQAQTLALDFDFAKPGTPEAMKDFIVALRDTLDAYDADDHPGADVTVVKGTTLEGVYVNGQMVEAAPRFEDFRPADTGDDEAGPFPAGWQPSAPDRDLGQPLDEAHEQGGAVASTPLAQSSVELQAGGNSLVNSAVIGSSWLAATVTAIMGDHVELNAIFQVNVWSDIDHVTSALAAAPGDVDTLAFNIAGFERIDPAADGPVAAAAGDFPTFWVVTQVTGDLLILNWIQQMTFMTDNDLAVLSATGSKVEIITGENGARNAVSLAELGHAYDLIFVGGSVYDASLIFQTNILMDDDLVGAVSGFGTSGPGSVATSGNLLWNEAGIVNVGAADRFEPMSQAYRDAGAQLASGDRSAPSGVLSDPAFAGSGPLKVLYITGDIINLNFIKQTNVLGDSDQVTLAMDAAKAVPDAAWTVSTGANTLVNFAKIVDVDALGKTYVAGNVYSDEVLVQAEFVSDSPSYDLAGKSPDALVSEAVAFLGDDAGTPTHDTGLLDHPIAPSPDLAPADPMQSILA